MSDQKLGSIGQVFIPYHKVEVRLLFEEQGEPTGFVSNLPATKDELAERINISIQKKQLDYGATLITTVVPPMTEVVQDLTLPIAFIPKRSMLTRNPYNVTDTVDIEAPLQALPFDPRSVRTGVVSLYMGTMTSRQYEVIQAQGIKSCDNPFTKTVRKDLRFMGRIDTMEVTWGDKDTVSIKARDYTSFFIDTIVPAALGSILPKDDTFDLFIAKMLNVHPAGKSLKIRLFLDGTDLLTKPVSKIFDAVTLSGPFGGVNVKSKKQVSLWDYITVLCGKLGLIPYFELDTLHIIEARTAWSSEFASTKDKNYSTLSYDNYRRQFYTPRDVRIDGVKYNLKNPVFIYGTNIGKLSVKKTFNSTKAVSIVARAIDQQRGIVVEAVYPDTEDLKAINSDVEKVSSETVDAILKTQKSKVVFVSGTTDQATLKRIAQGYYEDGARKEITGSLTTKDLASFGGTNLDPDVLDIHPGNTITVVAGGDVFQDQGSDARLNKVLERVSSGGTFDKMTPTEQQQYIKENLNIQDEGKLNVIIGHLKAMNQYQDFRVTGMKVTLDSNQGFEAFIDFKNYVVIRRNPEEMGARV